MVRLIVFVGIVGICTFSQAAYAQKKDKGDDVYGIPASPKDTVNHHQTMVDDQSFTIDDFVNGYVVLPSGIKRNGVVRFNGATAIYKDTIADKTTRYSPKEITEFVAAGDTFKVYIDTAIIPPTPHMASFGDKLFITKRFVKELIYGGKLCLYKSIAVNTPSYAPMMGVGPGGGWVSTGSFMSTGKTTIKNIFYLKREGEIQYTNIPTNKKDFKKILAKYFQDNDPLVQDIKAEKLVYEDIEEIVNRYNKKS